MSPPVLDAAPPPENKDIVELNFRLVEEFLSVAAQPITKPREPKSVEGAEDGDGPDTIDKNKIENRGKPKNEICEEFKFKGELFLIGGSANSTWLELVEKLPENPKVVVVTMASRLAGEDESLAKDFENAGIPANNITVITDQALPTQSKYQYSKVLPSKFDMIYFSGGAQDVLRERFNQVDKLKAALKSGSIIAGNSAGTAVMPCEMITGGTAVDLTHAGGFGLTPWAVTDTHVHQRGREDRDVSALYEIGRGVLPVVGVDIDTRVRFFWDAGRLVGEVGGKNSVYVLRKTDQNLQIQSNRTVVPDIIKGSAGAGLGKSARIWELKAGDKFFLR